MEGSLQCLIALSHPKSDRLTSSTYVNFKNTDSHCLAAFKLVDLKTFFFCKFSLSHHFCSIARASMLVRL